MNKTLFLVSCAVVGGVTATAFTLNNYIKQVQERFPDVDPKDARKAYLTMLMKAFSGKYGSVDTITDNEMDALFRAELFDILKNKK